MLVHMVIDLGSIVRRQDSAIRWIVIVSTVVKLLEKLSNYVYGLHI